MACPSPPPSPRLRNARVLGVIALVGGLSYPLVLAGLVLIGAYLGPTRSRQALALASVGLAVTAAGVAAIGLILSWHSERLIRWSASAMVLLVLSLLLWEAFG